MRISVFWFLLCVSTCAWAAGPETLSLSCDDLLRFKPQTLTVSAGASVTLTLTNEGRIPKFQHNFVLLKPGVTAAEIGNEAMARQGEVKDLPPSIQQKILAYTPMISAGASTKITFTAPAKGTYTFICSYPGHFSLSKGTLVVQ